MRGQNADRRRMNPSPVQIGLLIQLFSQLENSQFKPPVTIFFLFINLMVHMSPFVHFMGYDLSNISQNCIHPQTMVETFYKSKTLLFNRLLFSSVIHVDDMHLYYNMISLCWKGVHLESKIGSPQFFQLIVYSLVVSHTLMVLVSSSLNSMDVEPALSGYNSCAVGFSAVLFSLKYVWNAQSGEVHSSVMGIPVPTKYAAWLELVLISFITPNVSFIGHLCGIAAGVGYVHGSIILPRRLRELLSVSFSGHAHTDSSNTRYTYASGSLGGRSSGGSAGATAQSTQSTRASTPHNGSSSSSTAHTTSFQRSAAQDAFEEVELELEVSSGRSADGGKNGGTGTGTGTAALSEEEVASRATQARLQRLKRFGAK